MYMAYLTLGDVCVSTLPSVRAETRKLYLADLTGKRLCAQEAKDSDAAKESAAAAVATDDTSDTKVEPTGGDELVRATAVYGE